LLQEYAFGLAVKLNGRDERIRSLTENAAALGVKLNERDEHIRLLTENAAALELKFKAELQRQHDILSSENTRLRAHNELLTGNATEAVRKLQEIKQDDYQIIMAQQQLLAGPIHTCTP
jgi:hypothetical protein